MQTFSRVKTFAKSLNDTQKKKRQKQNSEYNCSTNIRLKPLDANSHGSCTVRSRNEISRKKRRSKRMSKQRSSSFKNVETCRNTCKSTGLAVLDTSTKILGMETSPRHRSDACEDALALSLNEISRKQRRSKPMSKQRSSSFRNVETCGNTCKSTGMAVLNTSSKILGMETSPRHRSDACEDALALSLNATLGKNRINITKREKKEDFNNRVKSKVSPQESTLSSRGKCSAITQRLRKLGMTHRSGEWIKMRDNDGYIYYYNNKTFESQWESPFRYQKIPQPWSLRKKDGVRMYINSKTGQELQEARSANGDVYFYDHSTGRSQWEKPWEKRALIKLARRLSNQDLHECKTYNEKSKKDMTTVRPVNKISRTGGVGYSSSISTSALPSIHNPLIY